MQNASLGGLRTAVESLPASRRARAIALSFSGGTLGGAAASYIAVPLGLKYGWRMAFAITGAFGIAWLALWALVARPPFLPKAEKKSTKLTPPNLSERRLWALVFSYALPAIAPGPILTLLSLYLNQGLGVSQAALRTLLLVPPLAWGLGYFFWVGSPIATPTITAGLWVCSCCSPRAHWFWALQRGPLR